MNEWKKRATKKRRTTKKRRKMRTRETENKRNNMINIKERK